MESVLCPCDSQSEVSTSGYEARFDTLGPTSCFPLNRACVESVLCRCDSQREVSTSGYKAQFDSAGDRVLVTSIFDKEGGGEGVGGGGRARMDIHFAWEFELLHV